MDTCESTNLAAEAETTSIEPKIPMCEAQVDRVSCISQSALSHSLNVAAQKVSEVPNVPCVQAKTDGTDNVMDIVRAQTWLLRQRPPVSNQKFLCVRLK